ncbi:Permease of the drug/metabolite transporter (DMT) superfamily [Desulfonispora thiosulfatigenes DSM 11270]|uniref:Permease of the drug/metabolite transporter (DMT) superfamily n=1 Tax=Desulfonispora thiosulfatigenes DSM 11270 TaxID=656914 RepID=A0A1W1UME2_DESTI|nr:DMT family transporter [Desulfonispora thiosulfatigenes]SMB81874.1 Permease of the drug/metabolite transporter (DMT) superfamily [Desulfonispora thiosulfatigenes DSM 11270]
MTSDNKTRLLLFSVPLMWGLNFPFMKVGLEFITPLAYSSLRMVFSVAVAWIILYYSKTYQKIVKEDWKSMFFVSFFGFFIFQVLFILGVNLTTSGNAAIIVALLPISVVILNTILKIEQISKKTFGVIAFSFVGILLVILGSGKELSLAHNHLIGALMLLVGQFFFAYYTIFSKRLMAKYSSYQVIAYVFSISTFFFFLISIPELIQLDYKAVPQMGWSSNIYSGIFAIGIGNIIWVWGINKIGSTGTALYNNLTPVFAVIFAFLILGEKFSFIQFIGAAIIFIGLSMNRNKAGSTISQQVVFSNDE